MSWPRTAWVEAVWTSNLPTTVKIVALAYADHARDKRQTWVSYPRLMERTGCSRDTCWKAQRLLRDSGWLTVVAVARQHRSTVYELTKPDVQSSAVRTAGKSSSRPIQRHQQSGRPDPTTGLTTGQDRTSPTALQEQKRADRKEQPTTNAPGSLGDADDE